MNGKKSNRKIELTIRAMAIATLILAANFSGARLIGMIVTEWQEN